jgi:hypothetical protein
MTHLASSSQEFHPLKAMDLQRAFTLPALRSLGDLAGAEPVIVIDTREQDPLPFFQAEDTGRRLDHR